MSNNPSPCPLLDLRERYGFNLGNLEQAAGLTHIVDMNEHPLARIISNLPIRRSDAEKILVGLKQLTGVDYHLEDLAFLVEE